MRTMNIGGQRFDRLRENHYFYVEKTDFIREWWESGDCRDDMFTPHRESPYDTFRMQHESAMKGHV